MTRIAGLSLPCHPVQSIPLKPSTMPDVVQQVRLAFQNLNAILHEAGCTFDDVVDVTVFMIDPQSIFERVRQIVPEFWGEAPHPPLTAVGATWLYGFDFELKVVAKLPTTDATGP